jgi:hypothetical protein
MHCCLGINGRRKEGELVRSYVSLGLTEGRGRGARDPQTKRREAEAEKRPRAQQVALSH